MSNTKNKKKTRRRSGIVEIFNGLLSLLIIGLLAAVGLVMYGAWSFYAEGPAQDDVVFQVERGLGLQSIATRLEEADLISSQWMFLAGAYALGKHASVRAGEFELEAGASMGDILKEFTEGRPIQYSVTIPEGFTSWQVAQRLLENETLLGSLETLPPEGTILPDTYLFERGATRAEILARMQSEMSEQLAEVWESRDPDLPVSSPEELVVLASIIEKETALASERPEVAAVFVNRLNASMRLQSDPTIIYGINQGQGPLGRGLTVSDIEEATPYNTYSIDGLPPGPIANPGIDSLRAAANPAESEALYFVADGTGGHAFANSYAEHRRNVAAWRSIEAEREEAASTDAEAARDALEAQAAEEAGLDTSDPE